MRLTIVGHDESCSNRRDPNRKSHANNEWQNMCVRECVCACDASDVSMIDWCVA